MTTRVIDPPRAQLDSLPTPLNEGERRVLDFLDQHLSVEWEIYVQPYLNGLRPDFVLLNPSTGIAVFEVKDWNLDAIDYRIEHTADRAQLAARRHNGEPVELNKRNPLEQVAQYKGEILNLYCPRLSTRYGGAARQAVTAGVIFTRATTERVRALLEPLRSVEMRAYPQYHPIAGFDDLRARGLNQVFPEHRRRSSAVMTAEAADDLRSWLREPAFSRDQRAALALDARQREIARSRTERGYRRVKGAAGSGKTVALAARAAELGAEGKEVLVCTFNITLMNYIRDLSRAYARAQSLARHTVQFQHFHGWCKRVCYQAGRGEDYRKLFRRYDSSGDQSNDRDPLFNTELPELVQEIWREQCGANHLNGLRRYDAILVDEGQDFRLDWWQTLQAALAKDGEMLLVADKTQNVFGNADVWTDQEMPHAGFRGPWFRLLRSYRLPPRIIPLLKEYAERFLQDEESDIPMVDQAELDLYPVALNWRQTTRAEAVGACVEALLGQMREIAGDAAVSDVTFLSGRAIGQAVLSELEQRGVQVLHTFDSNSKMQQRQKMQFFLGSGQVKATTLHSFKGWEAVHLVVYVGTVASREDRAVLYAALTRIKRREGGSALTVVCSTPDLASFGRRWPNYSDNTEGAVG